MSRFARLATGLRDFGNDINANISKALNISKVPDSPNDILLEEARAGRVQGLEALFDGALCAAEVNGALDPAFLSPLCLACAGGHEDAALFLLRRAAADPNNAAGAHAAAAAAAASACATATATFGEGGNINACGGEPGGDGRGGRGAGCMPPTPLVLAVETGLERVVDELLARGARVDARRAEDGWTALHVCASRGNALVMAALLSAAFADAGVRTSRLETPLSVASACGHLSVVDLLLGESADDTGSGGVGGGGGGGGGAKGAPLVMGGSELAATVEAGGGSAGGGGGGDSLRRGRGRRSPALPGCGKHAEERTWAGRTPLHRAASRGHTEVVLRLLAHGVNADPADSRGATPLILAARQGHWDAAHALVRGGGASVRVATREGDTALHAAAWAGATVYAADRVVKLLVKSGAEVDACNKFGSTALHLAAAAGAYGSVLALLAAGANPSATNSCGLSPGSCFLRPLGSVVPKTGMVAPGTSVAASSEVWEMRQALRENRERLGHVRRLADANAKRLVVATVAERATASVHRFVEFALKTQRWDVDARIHRTRLQRLDRFRAEIISEPYNPAAAAAPAGSASTNPGQCAGAGRSGSISEPEQTNEQALAVSPPPLLLDLSPEREGLASRAVKRREKAAVEAVKGARLALQDMEEWKGRVLAERQVVAAFLRGVDPTRALSAGAACDGDGQGGAEGAASLKADVIVTDQCFLSKERHAGERENAGIGRRRSRSVAGAGFSSSESSAGDATSPSENEGSPELGRRHSGGFGRGGGGSGGGGGGRGDRDRAGPVGFIRALAALNPCVGALREARAAGRSGDRLTTALETLREHVKSTLIDLMDLETSIPGNGADLSDEDSGNDIAIGGSGGGGGGGGDRGSGSGRAEPKLALTGADAGALDIKIVGLLRRLAGGGGGGGDDCAAGGAADKDGGEGGDSCGGPPSLATVYGDGLGGWATASEVEVDTTESLTAVALQMVMKAAAGPLLRALDDAHQRLIQADLELRRLIPEAEALIGGPGSAKELALEARGRLLKNRQQVVDEEDLLEELVSKLRRRRRQAAGDEEIGSLEDERLSTRARLASLQSAKLTELRALRRARAYERFPELLLEDPSRAESAFRGLLLRGIAVRDVDEWQEHHMASVASVESRRGWGGGGGGGGGGGSFGGGSSGGSERVLGGLGGERCRLAEIDGSAVAIVEVDCRDREAERALVATLLRFTPSTRRLFPELATVSAVSLRDGRAMFEVPIEGALTAKAWLAATGVSTGAAAMRPVLATGVSGDIIEPTRETGLAAMVPARGGVEEGKAGEEEEEEEGVGVKRTQLEVWVVMAQALRGLAAVHAMAEGSTHKAVCLENIIVAARPSPERSLAEEAGAAVAAAGAGSPAAGTATAFCSTNFSAKCTKGAGAQNTAGVSYSLERQASPSPRQPGFRRAQLGPPAPAALARAPTESVAPEVVRGQPFGQPADVYAFGVALRAASCGVKEVAAYYAPVDGVGASGGGAQAMLPAGRGPNAGPLRQALLQLLGSMLEEDPLQRCTVKEALSSDYFRMPPLDQPPGPIYPSQWSPFPVRTRRVSNTAPGSQPHWVAVALAGRKGEDSERGWFESCYAVDLPTSASGAAEGGRGGGEAGTEGKRESEAIQALLKRSLPGAHLLRLVRLQDRGRWLRFVCERDAATSASGATTTAVATAAAAAATAARGDGSEAATVRTAADSSRTSVSRLFADPRDVVEGDVLAAIEAAASSSGGGGKIGGRTVGATGSLGEAGAAGDNSGRTAGGPPPRWAASVQVRCAETARYAAVAFAPPLAKAGGGKSEGGGDSGGSDEQWTNGDVRTLAVVCAVTGGVSGAHAGRVGGSGSGGGGGRGILTKPTGVVATGSSSLGLFEDDDNDDGDDTKDPFLGVDPAVDLLTRASGVGAPSSPLVDSSGGDSGIDGISPLAAVTGLSPPAVHSVKTWEAMDGYWGGGGGSGPGQDSLGGGDGAGAGASTGGAVHALRRDACYPEYLVTFAL